jgi:uncharacterized protein (TIGR02444 family)
MMNSDDAWRGIVALYDEDGARVELLRRQDEEGLDVVLHLFVRWAAAQGVVLDAEARADAERLVAPWRGQVVVPLRTLRRALGASEADAARMRPVRSQLQAAELAAERAQVDLLCEWLQVR